LKAGLYHFVNWCICILVKWGWFPTLNVEP